MLRDMHPPHTAVSAFDSYEEEQVLIAAESLRQKIRRRCDHLTPGTVQSSTVPVLTLTPVAVIR